MSTDGKSDKRVIWRMLELTKQRAAEQARAFTAMGKPEEAYLAQSEADLAARALAQWEDIERAAKTLLHLHISDYTSDVRSREHVVDGTPEGQSTWDHPDVKAWAEASALVERIAKESP